MAIRASHGTSKIFFAPEKVIFSIFSKWDVDQAEIHVSILTIFDMDPDFESRKKDFRWYKSIFYIFPTCRRSISIKRTDPCSYTTLRSKVSTEKLKFDSATCTFKVTMFIYLLWTCDVLERFFCEKAIFVALICGCFFLFLAAFENNLWIVSTWGTM